jgi:hypothetical protein
MANNSIQRGPLPKYIVESLGFDEHGILTGSIKIPHRMSDAGVVKAEWLLDVPNPGWKIPLVSAAGAPGEAGLFWVTARFQGIGPQTQNGPQEDTTTFELDTSMNEEPIETHPAFKELKKIYGWDQTERRFAETLPQFGPKFDPKNGLSSDSQDSLENPLFGVDSWLVIAAVYRITFGSKVIPGDILTGIGTIIKSPPQIGQFKVPSNGKRNWLKLSPKLNKQGNAVRVTLEWALSGPKGWLKPIYSQGQLDKSK